ncbi:energy-coupling factor transport system permease protein [Raineyella antarctica]|uniref:Energy-coupling factor transport system permease protein n=1 Tax=Raineyella antarctica TaxID=1577474 RepID=A0A1G6H8K5_9ACTN|nr:energy-coupling factor transporter transmembrane component T [Raineyella antarctica]SDB90428.1 energy-coupling factor transport system permease protein [Raineyella antarctica]
MRRPSAAHDFRHPRDLHPGAWWAWALGLAVAASRTDNPVPLVLLAVVAGFVVAMKRTDAPWARAYTMFVRIALVVVALRVVLQAVLSTNTQGTHLLVVLPQLPLPDWVTGIKLGGPVTWEAVLSALYAGGQLAVVLVCFGAANALASPRRLLQLLPAALYEIQVALVVALTFAPQLVVDARRIHNARRLRGRRVRVRTLFRTTAMPVLESALDRSVALAAAMDARGYGRTRHLPRSRRRLTSALSLAGSGGLLVGLYGLLSASIRPALSIGAVLLGLALATTALVLGRVRATRTRYRPDPWALPEWLVAGSGALVAAVLVWSSLHGTGGLTMPSATAVPPLAPVPLLAILVGLLPALVAPVPAASAATPAPRSVEVVPS